MSGHPLIETYLRDLAAQLAPGLPRRRRSELLTELRAGLLDALDAHPAAATDPAGAARAVLGEFGTPSVVAAAYAPELAAAQARRSAGLTLTALPALAGLWAAALTQGAPPAWEHAPWLPVAEHLLAATLMTTLGCALIARVTTGRASRMLSDLRVPTVAARIAGLAAPAAVTVVLTLTALRALTAPASLAWPAVLGAAAATAAVLTAVHRAARHCRVSAVTTLEDPVPPRPGRAASNPIASEA